MAATAATGSWARRVAPGCWSTCSPAATPPLRGASVRRFRTATPSAPTDRCRSASSTSSDRREVPMSDAYRAQTVTVDGGPTALGSAGAFTLVIDRPTGAGGSGLGFNGGQLLYLAIAGCISN